MTFIFKIYYTSSDAYFKPIGGQAFGRHFSKLAMLDSNAGKNANIRASFFGRFQWRNVMI